MILTTLATLSLLHPTPRIARPERPCATLHSSKVVVDKRNKMHMHAAITVNTTYIRVSERTRDGVSTMYASSFAMPIEPSVITLDAEEQFPMNMPRTRLISSYTISGKACVPLTWSRAYNTQRRLFL